MNTLRIEQYPSTTLARGADPVEQFDPALAALAEAMLVTMREYKGIGLAAPQVGYAIRLIVVAVPGWPILEMVNPVIVNGRGDQLGEEGCLSAPGLKARIRRYQKIRVEYQDLAGNHHSMKANELLSRCIQHEIDHLEGRMFFDNLPADVRARLLQKGKYNVVSA
jgi:peptide deformylase